MEGTDFNVAFSSLGAVASPCSTASLGGTLVTRVSGRTPPIVKKKDTPRNTRMAATVNVKCLRGGIARLVYIIAQNWFEMAFLTLKIKVARYSHTNNR